MELAPKSCESLDLSLDLLRLLLNCLVGELEKRDFFFKKPNKLFPFSAMPSIKFIMMHYSWIMCINQILRVCVLIRL